MHPVIGEGIYRHYKGNLYRVLCTAKHTETQEELVIYEELTYEAKQWARPLSMWHEAVVADGITTPRFQFVANSLDDLDSKPLFKLIEAIVSHMETYDRMNEEGDLAFYDKRTGEVVTVSRRAIGLYEDGEDIDEYPPETIHDIERIYSELEAFIRLPDGDEVNEYTLMECFASEVPYRYQDALQRAIQGKGAFRRFKDTAERLGLLKHWYEYKTAAFRKEARQWCDFMKLPWAMEIIKRQE